jgi:RimJ/RimL family protein N-acetyltransferase
MKTETVSTILRPIEAKDTEQVFCYRSDAETNKYQGWIPKTLEDVSEFISKNPSEINKPETWFQLVIVEKASNKIIGDLGIHFIDSDNYQSEIGCTLSKTHHGKGIATETLRAIIDYLFRTLNKHRTVTSIDPANSDSMRLVERLGFRKEAHFKESLYMDKKWVDDIVYAMLKRNGNKIHFLVSSVPLETYS